MRQGVIEIADSSTISKESPLQLVHGVGERVDDFSLPHSVDLV